MGLEHSVNSAQICIRALSTLACEPHASVVGGFVIWKNADEIQLGKILEGNAVDVFEFAPEHKVQELLRFMFGMLRISHGLFHPVS
jgi:hypothetical protein